MPAARGRSLACQGVLAPRQITEPSAIETYSRPAAADMPSDDPGSALKRTIRGQPLKDQIRVAGLTVVSRSVANCQIVCVWRSFSTSAIAKAIGDETARESEVAISLFKGWPHCSPGPTVPPLFP